MQDNEKTKLYKLLKNHFLVKETEKLLNKKFKLLINNIKLDISDYSDPEIPSSWCITYPAGFLDETEILNAHIFAVLIWYYSEESFLSSRERHRLHADTYLRTTEMDLSNKAYEESKRVKTNE